MKNQSTQYDDRFYDRINEAAFRSASVIIPLVLSALPKIRSAIDFGCGQGVWLSVLKQLGVETVRGLDGCWVDHTTLKISEQEFSVVNFEQSISLERRYDLAISLEVAEHIPESKAGDFILSLTSAADFVLFSAAIPHQGGTNHVNEQWPEYWSKLFGLHGYIAVDYLRLAIWHVPEVAHWYKQNTILYVKNERRNCVCAPESAFFDKVSPCALVHPEQFLSSVSKEYHELPFWQECQRLLGRLKRRVMRPFMKHER